MDCFVVSLLAMTTLGELAGFGALMATLGDVPSPARRERVAEGRERVPFSPARSVARFEPSLSFLNTLSPGPSPASGRGERFDSGRGRDALAPGTG
jgi:hypothetical protein